MGPEYIIPPQVFVNGLTALGPGIQNLTENYPLLTTYQSWTSTASINTSAFQIPGSWSIYNGNNKEGSFIVSVGGVIQPPTTYTINDLTRTLTFNNIVSAGIEIAATQLATAAPSSQEFSYIKVLTGDFFNATFQNVTAINLTVLSSVLQVQETTILTPTSAISLTALDGALFLGSISAAGPITTNSNVSAKTLTLSSITFTNEYTTATNLTATGTVIKVLINNQPKYIPLFDIN